MSRPAHRVLPGFGLTTGITLAWLSLLVLIPLAALVVKTSSLTWPRFWETVSADRTVAALGLSFGAALVAATVNAVAGAIIAWGLVRYRFPGRRIIDAIIDLPFALPTAVAGIALTALYAKNGWIGRHLVPGTWPGDTALWLIGPEGLLAQAVGQHGVLMGPQGLAYSRLGVVIALIFIGLPFVVRTLQPVLEEIPQEIEEAATSLGAGRLAILRSVIMPEALPALITGFALAFARAVGEFGSVIFIAGNIPGLTEIAPLLIVIQLEQYHYAEATAIAVVMLVFSFAMLLAINLLQRWMDRRTRSQT